jgi:hypothetical protein
VPLSSAVLNDIVAAAVLSLAFAGPAAAQSDDAPPLAPPTAAEIAAVPQDAPDVKALAILVQVETSLAENVASGELGQVHNEDMFLHAALGQLQKDAMEANRQHVVAALQTVGRAVADLHDAADAFDQERANRLLAPLRSAFAMALDFHDRVRVAAARRLADRYTCPMHPDVTGARTDGCPKCGMVLDLPARLHLQPLQGSPAKVVFAQVRLDAPLVVGQEASGVLVLKERIGEPVQIFQLREVHTKKIHLLIIDESLTDYHHEHPTATDTPGEYRFSFTPRRPGPYRAWADVQPLVSGIQEYAMADLKVAEGGGGPLEKTFPRDGEQDGLRYTLALEHETVRAGRPTNATVHVVEAAKQRPFTGLEPLMGAFAHLVGFHEDHKTVLHIHPVESRKLGPEDRGGPDLAFRLYTETPGYYRLFLQVQVGGASRFIPFGVEVAPAE